jgi:two-component system, LytTR family, response regulator
MITALLIDDEPPAREALRGLLTRFCTDVEIVGEAHNIILAEQLIESRKPQLLFLDIEMPYGSGFDLLEKIKTPTFKVIFTTGFDQYAINAIRFAALDYLLKPIDIDELKNAVQKAKQAIEQQEQLDDYQNLLSILDKEGSQHNKMAVIENGKVTMVEVSQIAALETSHHQTIIHLDNGESISSTQNIKNYEDLLADYDFARINNSFLVNSVHAAKNSSEVSKLSKREFSVLEYLSNGYSYKMIAADCDISLETVRTYIKRIYQKLDVHSVSEATSKYYRR